MRRRTSCLPSHSKALGCNNGSTPASAVNTKQNRGRAWHKSTLEKQAWCVTKRLANQMDRSFRILSIHLPESTYGSRRESHRPQSHNRNRHGVRRCLCDKSQRDVRSLHHAAVHLLHYESRYRSYGRGLRISRGSIRFVHRPSPSCRCCAYANRPGLIYRCGQ